jgi:uncharacterized protein (DUF1684 family)
MKSILIIASFILSLSAVSQQSYRDSIQGLRKKSQERLLGSNMVLQQKEIDKIVSLSYYPVDESWVKHVHFEKDKGKPFDMPTSTDRMPCYRRVGYIHFEHEGKQQRLTIYKSLDLKGSEYKNYYFLPFKDLTAPNETYGAGRYVELDLNLKKKNAFTIDFNTAFNPYCVYSYRFSCPLTPEENQLSIRIEAGEKLPIKKD